MLSFKTIADLKLYLEVIFDTWKHKINSSFKDTLSFSLRFYFHIKTFHYIWLDFLWRSFYVYTFNKSLYCYCNFCGEKNQSSSLSIHYSYENIKSYSYLQLTRSFINKQKWLKIQIIIKSAGYKLGNVLFAPLRV